MSTIAFAQPTNLRPLAHQPRQCCAISFRCRSAAPSVRRQERAVMASAAKPSGEVAVVEIGCGTDLHGQDANVAAVRACKNAIEFNSLPCLLRLLPDGDFNKMTVSVKLGVPRAFMADVDEERVRSQFPYGKVLVEVTEGGLVCGSAVVLAEHGDAKDDDRALVVVAAVSVYC